MNWRLVFIIYFANKYEMILDTIVPKLRLPFHCSHFTWKCIWVVLHLPLSLTSLPTQLVSIFKNVCVCLVKFKITTEVRNGYYCNRAKLSTYLPMLLGLEIQELIQMNEAKIHSTDRRKDEIKIGDMGISCVCWGSKVTFMEL